MPDLSPLTDAQRAALKEMELALTMYRQAVERRVEAERNEEQALHRLYGLGYEIAGVK